MVCAPVRSIIPENSGIIDRTGAQTIKLEDYRPYRRTNNALSLTWISTNSTMGDRTLSYRAGNKMNTIGYHGYSLMQIGIVDRFNTTELQWLEH